MVPATFMLSAFALSILGGLVGALLGLGGGVVIVPALTLVLGVDIRYAIGASIVSVIATSSGAGAAYIRDRLVNIRVSMFLELATTIGALVGAVLAGVVGGRWLYLIFALAMAYTAWAMWRHDETTHARRVRPDALADAWRLHGQFADPLAGEQVAYRVHRSRLGFGLGGLAGAVSGLLGIGGGVIKVPAMALGMGLPLKVATASSNFMIGVTAAASAGVYFARGDVDPFIAGPTSLGVLAGSLLGTRLMRRLHSSALRAAFTVVLIVVAVQMAVKGMRL